jgi:hypothetical protein
VWASRLFNESDLLKLPLSGGHDAGLRRLRSYLRLTGGTLLVALLAFLAGTADGASQPKRVAFRVTLQATVTKDWDALTETNENGCPTVRRSIGRRTVRLHSRRPTTVLVTFDRGRVSYAPVVVRFVAGELVQTGNRTTSVKAPCAEHTTHSRCARRRRAVTGASFGFFRSAHDEISFRARRLPDLPRGCPPESSEVRGIQPGLDEAQGELSEAALANSRIPIQTAIGTAKVTTDLEDQETGRVLERVRWTLTFTRTR